MKKKNKSVKEGGNTKGDRRNKCHICGKKRKIISGISQELFYAGNLNAKISFKPEEPVCTKCWTEIFLEINNAVKKIVKKLSE